MDISSSSERQSLGQDSPTANPSGAALSANGKVLASQEVDGVTKQQMEHWFKEAGPDSEGVLAPNKAAEFMARAGISRGQLKQVGQPQGSALHGITDIPTLQLK